MPLKSGKSKSCIREHQHDDEREEISSEAGCCYCSEQGWYEEADEEDSRSWSMKGLYANIQAKRKRIAEGSGEKMRKVGSKGAPTAKAFKEAAKTAKKKKNG